MCIFPTVLQCCVTNPFLILFFFPPSSPHPFPPLPLLLMKGAPEIPSLSGSSHVPVPVSPQPSQSEASVHVSSQPQPQATETMSEFSRHDVLLYCVNRLLPYFFFPPSTPHPFPPPPLLLMKGAPEMLSLSGGSHDPVPVLPQSSQSEASVHVSPQPQPQPQATETMSEFICRIDGKENGGGVFE